MKPIIDRILAWTISKKLLVWAVGTVMVFMGFTISDNWLILSGIYLGIQGIIDVFKEKIKASAKEDIYSGLPHGYPVNDDELQK